MELTQNSDQTVLATGGDQYSKSDLKQFHVFASLNDVAMLRTTEIVNQFWLIPTQGEKLVKIDLDFEKKMTQVMKNDKDIKDIYRTKEEKDEYKEGFAELGRVRCAVWNDAIRHYKKRITFSKVYLVCQHKDYPEKVFAAMRYLRQPAKSDTDLLSVKISVVGEKLVLIVSFGMEIEEEVEDYYDNIFIYTPKPEVPKMVKREKVVGVIEMPFPTEREVFGWNKPEIRKQFLQNFRQKPEPLLVKELSASPSSPF